MIPQISLIMGSCAGGHVYSPAVTDFTIMVDGTSNMFITGPDVIKTVTGEDVTMEELGGARTHNTKSGNAHYMGSDEDDAIEYVKALLSYLPAEQPRRGAVVRRRRPTSRSPTSTATLDTLIPDSPNQPYDMHDVITAVVDDEEFLEVQELFAPNIIIGFGRVEGRSVGVVANQPMQFAGTLDIDASEKAARFVRFCDAFNIPVLTFVDVPGFLPGTDQEWNGIIRRGAKLIYAYAEATVPLVTVITRKAYGGAYDVMGSKHLGADINLAWPTAQIAVMGAQGAVNILYRNELKDGRRTARGHARRADRRVRATLANPYLAAERGYVDAVISPHETRVEIVRALRLLRSKRETLPAEEAREHPAVMATATTEPSSARCCAWSRATPPPRRSPPWSRWSPRSAAAAPSRRRGVRRSGRRTTARSAHPAARPGRLALQRPAALTTHESARRRIAQSGHA